MTDEKPRISPEREAAMRARALEQEAQAAAYFEAHPGLGGFTPGGGGPEVIEPETDTDTDTDTDTSTLIGGEEFNQPAPKTADLAAPPAGNNAPPAGNNAPSAGNNAPSASEAPPSDDQAPASSSTSTSTSTSTDVSS